MHRIKEFILHHQGCEQHVLSCEVSYSVLSMVVCCCSGICLLSALHCRGQLTVPKQKKEKQGCVEQPHQPNTYGFFLGSFAKALTA